MKATTNYHLNQWDPGDRILRTEFNGDNGKIDSAIQGVRQDLTAETTARQAGEATAAAAVAGAKSEAANAVAGAKNAAANAVAGAKSEAATAVAGAKSEAANAVAGAKSEAANAVAGAKNEAAAATNAVAGRVAALEEKSGLKLLRTITTTQGAQSVSVQFGGIPWASYRRIHVELAPLCTNGCHLQVYLCDNSSNDMGSFYGNIGSPATKTFWATFFPMYSAERGGSPLCIGTHGSKILNYSSSCSNVTSIMLACASGNAVLPGSLTRIYGEE